ncbi:MAG TPA: hypothetical protein VLL51_05550 [Gemmatimonadales bacterium]|nr:hypothetical protein [Gemmatimonadales bacterium]
MRRVLSLALLLALAPLTAMAQSGNGAAPALAGTWRGPVITDGPSGIMTMVLSQEAGVWKNITSFEGDGIPPAGEARDVRVEGNVITWTQTVAEYEVMYQATVDGDLMRGELVAYQGGAMVAGGSFELKKQPAGAP